MNRCPNDGHILIERKRYIPKYKFDEDGFIDSGYIMSWYCDKCGKWFKI